MKRLSKEITTEFFSKPENYQLVKKQWSEKIQKRTQLSADAHLLYLVLMGKDWTESFQTKKNIQKDEIFNSGAMKAMKKLRYRLQSCSNTAIFSEIADITLFSLDSKDKILAVLPEERTIYNSIASKKGLPEYKGDSPRPGFMAMIAKFFCGKL